MADSGDERLGFPKAVWGCVAAWLVLAILAVIWGVPNEENDLTDRASDLLSGTGLSVRFEGRDATVTGSAEQADIANVKDIIYSVRGVHTVDISAAQAAAPVTTTTQPPATTTTTEPPALSSPNMTAGFSAGVVVLAGEMPNQAAIEAIETAAISLYGAASVASEMAVGAVAERDYVATLPQIFAATAGLDPWSLTLEDDLLSFSGLGANSDAVAAGQNALGSFTAAASLTNADIVLEVDPAAVAASLTELLAGGANFETGSATLAAEATVKLDEIIEIMLDNPSTVLVVEGHTDSQGDAAANQALSESRAEAVVDYLVAGGVAADRLTAIGYGEERPIAGNDTAEGRAVNRRIEFVVSEGE